MLTFVLSFDNINIIKMSKKKDKRFSKMFKRKLIDERTMIIKADSKEALLLFCYWTFWNVYTFIDKLYPDGNLKKMFEDIKNGEIK